MGDYGSLVAAYDVIGDQETMKRWWCGWRRSVVCGCMAGKREGEGLQKGENKITVNQQFAGFSTTQVSRTIISYGNAFLSKVESLEV